MHVHIHTLRHSVELATTGVSLNWQSVLRTVTGEDGHSSSPTWITQSPSGMTIMAPGYSPAPGIKLHGFPLLSLRSSVQFLLSFGVRNLLEACCYCCCCCSYCNTCCRQGGRSTRASFDFVTKSWDTVANSAYPAHRSPDVLPAAIPFAFPE
ncbi:hypothetical protein L209DRAFT_337972 [Thermothelomyces heterothallicus CBS 203.75]